MTKLIHNSRQSRLEVKDGRKVVASVPTALSQTALEGLLAATNPDDFEDVASLVAHIEATLAALAARKGSVIPDEYRYRYGVDQNCGDDVAIRLKDATTDPEGHVDLARLAEIASRNGVSDRYDVWLHKGLNNGMLRMNLGNVLRGIARKGAEVTI